MLYSSEESLLVPEPLCNSLIEELSEIDWKTLTSMESKRYYYGVETYFREGWSDVKRSFGRYSASILHQFALIVFKPDAIVGRRLRPALTFLEEHDFTPVYFTPLCYSRHSMREDWRYQLNQLTLDRMRLSTILAEYMNSLIVVLRDDTKTRRVPASVRLQSLKGSSYPHKQEANHLRKVLRSWTRLMKFIHTPDEPADLIRELAIFFEAPERQKLLEAMKSSQTGDCRRELDCAINDLYLAIPEHDLDLDLSWIRLRQRLAQMAETNEAVAHIFMLLEDTVNACRSGRTLAWSALEEKLLLAGIPIDWDILVVASAYIQHSYDGEKGIITGDGYKGWLDGSAHLVV